MSTANNPTCATGCNVVPPVVSFTDCDPEVHEGEIDRIYIMSLGGTVFNDWTSLAEWTAKLDNAGLTDDDIRFFNVIGEKPAAEGDQKKISRNRKIVLQKKHTVNFDIDETNLTNYNAMRQLECGGNYKLWYQTVGGHLYGGNLGIEAFIDINNVIGKDRTEFELLVGSATWDAKFHPEICDNPMA